MNTGLLLEGRTPDWEGPDACPEWDDRWKDLKLEPLLEAMSGDDPEIRRVCRRLLNSPLRTPEEILYRQEILKECLEKPRIPERLYEICREAEEKRKNTWGRLTSPHLTTVYSSAADLLKIYMEALVEIRRELEGRTFTSRGLRQLTELLTRELSDDYLDQVRSLQTGIGERDGMVISAGFGSFLQGVSYVRRQPLKGRLHWLLQPSFTLGERDMNGAKDLEIRRDRAINEVASVMAQAAGNLQSFVDGLRRELAFYLGGIRLHRALAHCPVCFPRPVSGNQRRFQGLRDASLALTDRKAPVGNSVEARGKTVWLITGANQGGKTTFLRSVGICQLMAQCGLFVCAEACDFPLRSQIFTHFGREEDRSLNSGRLDEELGRMSAIVDRLLPGAMVLSNESFSSTNDRDGSEILEGVVRGLADQGIEVFAVTHLMGFADRAARWTDALSLRPERTENGGRTFRLRQEAPAPEAYAEDIFREIFPDRASGGISDDSAIIS